MSARFVDVDELFEVLSKSLPEKKDKTQFAFPAKPVKPDNLRLPTNPDLMDFNFPDAPAPPKVAQVIELVEEEEDEPEDQTYSELLPQFSPSQSIPYVSPSADMAADTRAASVPTYTEKTESAPEDIELDPTYYGERYDPEKTTKIDFSIRSSLDDDIIYGRTKQVKVFF